MNKLILTGVALSLCIFQSCHNNEKPDFSKQELIAMQNAGIASRAEIKAANIALTSSKNPRVISYAKMLIQDYKTDLEKLKDVETPASATDSSHITSFYQKQMNSISGLSGAQFDKAYMNNELASTGQLLMFYVGAVQGTKDSTTSLNLKTALSVQVHIDSVKDILRSLK